MSLGTGIKRSLEVATVVVGFSLTAFYLRRYLDIATGEGVMMLIIFGAAVSAALWLPIRYIIRGFEFNK